MEADILVVGLAVLGFGLIANRLEGSPLTMPMTFTALGILLAPGVLGVLHIDVGTEGVSVLAEAALAVVLFTDASRMDLRNVAAILEAIRAGDAEQRAARCTTTSSRPGTICAPTFSRRSPPDRPPEPPPPRCGANLSSGPHATRADAPLLHW